jgi:hypothetical protein
MHPRIFQAVLASSLVAIAMPAFADATCREGTEPRSFTLPNGRVQTLCLPPAGVEGQSHASSKSPLSAVPATCPCFEAGEVEEAVAALGGSYRYQEGIAGRDAAGNTCIYQEVAGARTLFASMVKATEPTVPCDVQPIVPMSTINPSGCFSLYLGITIRGWPLPVDQAQACSAILAEFRR